MKKLKASDLQALSEDEQGLLFNYFGAQGGVNHRRKLALGLALMGCLLIGMAYILDGVISEVPNVPEWFPMMQWIAKIAPSVCVPVVVFGNLWMARSCQREAQDLAKELAERGFDVSGLTNEEVFEHVVMPIFRRSGLRIKE